MHIQKALRKPMVIIMVISYMWRKKFRTLFTLIIEIYSKALLSFVCVDAEYLVLSTNYKIV